MSSRNAAATAATSAGDPLVSNPLVGGSNMSGNENNNNDDSGASSKGGLKKTRGKGQRKDKEDKAHEAGNGGDEGVPQSGYAMSGGDHLVHGAEQGEQLPTGEEHAGKGWNSNNNSHNIVGTDAYAYAYDDAGDDAATPASKKVSTEVMNQAIEEYNREKDEHIRANRNTHGIVSKISRKHGIPYSRFYAYATGRKPQGRYGMVGRPTDESGTLSPMYQGGGGGGDQYPYGQPQGDSSGGQTPNPNPSLSFPGQDGPSQAEVQAQAQGQVRRPRGRPPKSSQYASQQHPGQLGQNGTNSAAATAAAAAAAAAAVSSAGGVSQGISGPPPGSGMMQYDPNAHHAMNNPHAHAHAHPQAYHMDPALVPASNFAPYPGMSNAGANAYSPSNANPKSKPPQAGGQAIADLEAYKEQLQGALDELKSEYDKAQLQGTGTRGIIKQIAEKHQMPYNHLYNCYHGKIDINRLGKRGRPAKPNQTKQSSSQQSHPQPYRQQPQHQPPGQNQEYPQVGQYEEPPPPPPPPPHPAAASGGGSGGPEHDAPGQAAGGPSKSRKKGGN